MVLTPLLLLLAFQVLTCAHIGSCYACIVLSVGWLVGLQFHLAALTLSILSVLYVEASLLGGWRSYLFFAGIHLVLACLLDCNIFNLDLDPFVGLKPMQILSQGYSLIQLPSLRRFGINKTIVLLCINPVVPCLNWLTRMSEALEVILCLFDR